MTRHNQLDFAVVGAQKSATSWLYYCLRDHPEVVVARNKHEREYWGGPVATEHGREWFFDRFPEAAPGQVVGDVSVNYLADLGSARALEAVAPDLKVIALLRDPLRRAVSSYLWGLRTNQVHEFDLSKELSRALDLFEAGRGAEHPVLVETLTRGHYAEQLKPFIDTFGPESVWVGLYEDVAREPLEVTGGVFRFLGVDGRFEPPSLNRPAKQTVHAPWLIRLERWSMRSLTARRVIERVKLAALTVMTPERAPTLRPDVAQRLREHFAPFVAATQEQLARLPDGQKPTQRLGEAWSTR